MLLDIDDFPGIPTLAPSFLPKEVKVWIQSENGILGMVSQLLNPGRDERQDIDRLSKGPYPTEEEVDA